MIPGTLYGKVMAGLMSHCARDFHWLVLKNEL